MPGFMANLGNAQQATWAGQEKNQQGQLNDARIQSAQLGNMIQQLALKKQQLDWQADQDMGNGAAGSAPQAPQVPIPGAQPMQAAPQAQGVPQGGTAAPLMPVTGGGRTAPPPMNVPMPGAGPTLPRGSPQDIAASAKQQMGQQPPAAQPQAQQPQQGQAGPQPVPTWRQLAADIKKNNPDMDGHEIMSIVRQSAELSGAQSKADYENFLMHVKQQQMQQMSPADVAEAADIWAKTGQAPTRLSEPDKRQVFQYMRDNNISGQDISTAQSRQRGANSAAGAQGRVIGGQTGVAEATNAKLEQLEPQALAAMKALDNGQWKTGNTIVNLIKQQGSSSAFAKANAINTSVIEAAAQGMSGSTTGTMHDLQQKTMTELLNTSTSYEAYKATYDAIVAAGQGKAGALNALAAREGIKMPGASGQGGGSSGKADLRYNQETGDFEPIQ